MKSEAATRLADALRSAGRLEQSPLDREAAGDPDVVRLSFELRREGEYWTIASREREFRLRDSKGLRVLAQLVSSPGRELHVLDLASPALDVAQSRDAGDAGEMLDRDARAAYRTRVERLRAEIIQAEEWHDVARAARLKEELDFVARELSSAVGLGGRSRRTGSATERARINVYRQVRDAIRRIEKHDPRLGRRLSRAVRTGTFCRYQPDDL
jgi:hypothetical protein